MEPTENQPGRDRGILPALYAVVGVVAVFAFIVSYTHIYDLGTAHGQHGIAAKGMPLSVDLLIVAASIVLWIQRRHGHRPAGLARGLPRLLLWAGIAATVAANMEYGVPFGAVGMTISAWPGAVFAGLVEMLLVTVRPAPQSESQNENPAHVPAVHQVVPASAVEAARLAYEASVAGGNPLPGRQLEARFGITRGQADKIRGRGAVTPGDGGAPATPDRDRGVRAAKRPPGVPVTLVSERPAGGAQHDVPAGGGNPPAAPAGASNGRAGHG